MATLASSAHLDHVATGTASWAACRRALAEEYAADHAIPWIVGFSGGKDSTVVAHLVFEHLLSLPRSERKRKVHIVANDTLVESPLVIGHVKAVLDEIRRAATAFDLPVVVATTAPDVDQTFWVNLIGRGYPPPNRSFRWCTDRMKIQPTIQYIKREVDSSGSVILLLGVRRAESAARAASVSRYDNGERLNRHNDLPGCWVFRPIVDLTTDDIWDFLGSEAPPWGGSHARLIKLYRDSGGGECPVVTAKSDAPSCGTSSPRFGCWTCTVVKKDRSLSGFVDSGFQELAPLLDFRDWLVRIRNDPERRLARRRDGRFTLTQSGVHIPGPFTIATRAEILEKLLALQERVGLELISTTEVERIRSLWVEDALNEVRRASLSQ
ncbi:MAG: DNA phosphorothioation system sulfurtransferase DndC [Casimicrobiaceae bacterium]|nr:DNA phosphorothioation system sulfurtransferase DndC [Casimicrobiaceae bacterium]